MRILLVEDDPKNIAVAEEQFAEHELIIASSYQEFEQKNGCIVARKKEDRVDLILTDLQIPLGRFPEGCITLNQNTQPTDLYPIGLVVLLLARQYNILCFLVSAINHHEDAWARILEGSCLEANTCIDLLISRDSVNHNIRKQFIDYHDGGGSKNWLGTIERYIRCYFLRMLGEKELADYLWKEWREEEPGSLSLASKTLCFEWLEKWTKL